VVLHQGRYLQCILSKCEMHSSQMEGVELTGAEICIMFAKHVSGK